MKSLLIQDSAFVIILNNKKILIQKRIDNDKWGLPGGCQEIKDRF